VIGIPKLSAKDKNVFSEERHSEVSAFPTKKQSTSRWETPFTLNLEFIGKKYFSVAKLPEKKETYI
jgi:hypothetical protein